MPSALRTFRVNVLVAEPASPVEKREPGMSSQDWTREPSKETHCAKLTYAGPMVRKSRGPSNGARPL